MSIHFETYSIPDSLMEDISIPTEATEEIARRLRVINRKLIKKMESINRKERSSWKNSQLRN